MPWNIHPVTYWVRWSCFHTKGLAESWTNNIHGIRYLSSALIVLVTEVKFSIYRTIFKNNFICLQKKTISIIWQFFCPYLSECKQNGERLHENQVTIREYFMATGLSQYMGVYISYFVDTHLNKIGTFMRITQILCETISEEL